MKRVAWWLNLDSDEELAHPRGYTRSRAMEERLARLEQELQGLVRPGDVVLRPGTTLQSPRELVGHPWCPTASARRGLEASGVILPELPPLEVVRAVNSRAFSDPLARLPGARFVRRVRELAGLLAEPSPTGARLVKSAFTCSGRGHLRLLDRPSAKELAWCENALLREGGLQVEPLVSRLLDVSVHGWVARDHAVIGRACVQQCDERGAWQSSREAREGELLLDEARELARAASHAAESLRRAGYFGPFGIDAFRWRDPDGENRFHPCSDLNARYTMGWWLGLDDLPTYENQGHVPASRGDGVQDALP